MKDVLKFLDLDSIEYSDKNLDLIRNAVESWIQEVYCRRTLVSTTYRERYDGNNDPYLILDNYPVTAVAMLSVGMEEVIRIKNTNAGAFASVSVNSTSLVLNKDGTSTTLLFATYTTMTAVVNAINALSGWSATLSMAAYGAYPSVLLVDKMGLSCINNAEVGLEMPKVGEWDFEVDGIRGMIYSPFGFPEGVKNIYINYTAGYATIPDDLKLATLIIIKNIYQHRSEESFGMTGYSVAGISTSFEQNPIPSQAKDILDRKYRRLIA
jgi:hypothetical protein